MRYILFFLCFLFRVYSSNSQFSDSVHHYVRYGLSGIINRTNDGRSFVLNNALAFNVKKTKIDYNFSNSWIYGRQNTSLLNNDFSSVLNVDILKNAHRLYYWALGSFTSSYSLKIRNQFQSGVGFGYSIIRKSNAELVISDGILYESGDLKLANGTHQVYNLFRNSLRLKYLWRISDKFELNGMHFWQPSLESLNDYIIRSSSGLSLKLNKWLSLNTTVTYNKISRTNKENLLINFGLIAERYF
jgi:hypothetical protein